MSYAERKEQILELLRINQKIQTNALAKTMFLSKSTLRRDLIKMEQEGIIIRSYGTIIGSNASADINVPFDKRAIVFYEIKNKLMTAAIRQTVKNGSVIMLDASSTILSGIQELNNFSNLIVITSGIKTAMALSNMNLKFYSTGGKSINSSYSLVGQLAINTISAFNADVCFISCHALNEFGYVSDNSETENDVRLAMMKHSRKKILLLDSSKININSYHNLCHVSEFDDVYCNEALPENIAKTLRNFHLIK